MFMIRRQALKYIACPADPLLLFGLARDPLELRNLAGESPHSADAAQHAREVERRWDASAIRRSVIESRRARRLGHEALMVDRLTPWDYQPRKEAAHSYFRNYGGLDPERPARLPAAPSQARRR